MERVASKPPLRKVQILSISQGVRPIQVETFLRKRRFSIPNLSDCTSSSRSGNPFSGVKVEVGLRPNHSQNRCSRLFLTGVAGRALRGGRVAARHLWSDAVRARHDRALRLRVLLTGRDRRCSLQRRAQTVRTGTRVGPFSNVFFTRPASPVLQELSFRSLLEFLFR